MMTYGSPVFMPTAEGFAAKMESKKDSKTKKDSDHFMNYDSSPAGAKDAYQPMGPFDGVRLSTGNNVSSYRYNHPDEPMAGNYPPFELGMDNLFMFKDNQVKPECCPSSYSSDTGCICTSAKQRAFLNSRGNNRTVEDGF